ncbi:hypothetical protein GGH13_009033 [Coemansia sp. S155-1]|nr:hypothetical protein GGH13_009033 [Coemansia sp. S155-1]
MYSAASEIRVEPRSLASLNYMRSHKMSFYAKLQFDNNTISIAKRPGFSMRNYTSFKYSTMALDAEECCYIAYAHKNIYEQYSTALVVYSTPYVSREQLWRLKSKSKEVQSLLGYNYVIDEDSKSRLQTLHTQRPIASPVPSTPIYSPAMSVFQTPASVYMTSPMISSGYAPWITHQPAINAVYNTPQYYADIPAPAKVNSPAVKPIGEMFDSNFGLPAAGGTTANTHRLADNGALEFFFDDDLLAGQFGLMGVTPRETASNRPEPAPRAVNNGQPETAPRPATRPPPAPHNMFAPIDQEDNGGGHYSPPTGWNFYPK